LINEKWGLDISVDLNFAVFNEANGNAEADGEQSTDTSDNDGIIGEEITEGVDDEFQVDGVQEDEAKPEPEPTMEDEISKEIGDKKEGEDK